MVREYTWEELAQLPVGHCLQDWEEGPYRCLIQRGPLSLCAYIGLPADHPFYKKYYYKLNFPFIAKGLTYSASSVQGRDYYGWFLGWDYIDSNLALTCGLDVLKAPYLFYNKQGDSLLAGVYKDLLTAIKLLDFYYKVKLQGNIEDCLAHLVSPIINRNQ